MREEDGSNIRGGWTDMDLYERPTTEPAGCNPGQTNIKYDQLYLAANRLMVIIGAVGSVDSRHDAVSAVMDALHDIDGGAPPNV